MAKTGCFCHVFLSFKGETRNKFTCFLFEALKAQGFEIFMDKETIRVGDEVDSRIQDGIRGSMSAIVVFSENYAYSTWCLDELLLILERKRTSRYFIIPIFYEVEPADIRHQRGSFGDALEKHKKRHSVEKVEKWRHALFEVANILGEHVQGMQSIFIKNIVKIFQEKMSMEFPQFRLPLILPIVPPRNSTASTSSIKRNDKVVLYMTEDPFGSSIATLRLILVRNNVLFEERNCHKDPKYIKELQELVGHNNVELPMLIVNGKDLCGEEEIEGLEDFEGLQLKQKLRFALNNIRVSRRQIDSIHEGMRARSSFWDSVSKNNSGRSSFWDSVSENGSGRSSFWEAIGK